MSRDYTKGDEITRETRILEYLEKVLEKDKLYHHCVSCGLIAADGDFTKPLFNIVDLFSCPATPLPIDFLEYNVSGTLCNICFSRIRQRRASGNKKSLINSL